MDYNEDIGGCCGFMGCKPEREYDDYGYDSTEIDEKALGLVSNLFRNIFSIMEAQVFEYNFAHMIDKPFESVFGFIHVLPGAFSAYRWKALADDDFSDDT